mmetsp:Transcript_13288/g.52964  ORF Transcript_13288/g.52964 Transcript_13288/m.52964 type:complete len:230 (-) Transcript_13288:209-898(-)
MRRHASRPVCEVVVRGGGQPLSIQRVLRDPDCRPRQECAAGVATPAEEPSAWRTHNGVSGPYGCHAVHDHRCPRDALRSRAFRFRRAVPGDTSRGCSQRAVSFRPIHAHEPQLVRARKDLPQPARYMGRKCDRVLVSMFHHAAGHRQRPRPHPWLCGAFLPGSRLRTPSRPARRAPEFAHLQSARSSLFTHTLRTHVSHMQSKPCFWWPRPKSRTTHSGTLPLRSSTTP